MRRFLAGSLAAIAVAALLPVLAAAPVVDRWEPLGGYLVDGPAAASPSAGRLDVFVRGGDNQLYHKSWQNGWSDYEPLGGYLTAAPAAASPSAGRLDVFVRGLDNQLYHKSWQNGWSDYEPLGGYLVDGPAAASPSAGRLDVFVRGGDNQLYHKSWQNGWSDYEPLGGYLTVAPAAASPSAGRLDVFVRGLDNQLYHKSWQNGWSDYEPLGGYLVDGPAAASPSAGRLDVFVRGGDNQLYHKSWQNGWSDYEPLGGYLTVAPAAASPSAGRLDVFVRGGDNQLWHKWSGADETPPTSTTPPTTATTTTTTTRPPATGDPAPAFVACGPNRNSAMNSPDSTFAAAKASFPNATYVDLPAGDNSGQIGQNWMLSPNTTYFFEPGTHYIGGGQFSQVMAKNGDVFVGAPGAVIDGQSRNNYAFTGDATGVTIAYLEITHFMSPLDEGVVNHDAGRAWTMRYNYMHDNGGAAMILGDNNTGQYNCLDHNAQYGFQIFGNTVTVSFNEISRNNSANVESSNPGCGCSGGMKAWEATNVVLNNNWVHNNLNVGLWIDTNNLGFDISGNVITDNTAEAIIYETSYNFHITNNYIARNVWVKGMENPGFPNPAIYISESGGDSRVGSLYATSEIANNTLVDNWGGITLWENANRYCSGAGGDHVCTIVNPGVATLSTCGSTLIATAPYIDDCRWKTKNVSVHDNRLTLTPANIPNCTTGNDCGDMALVSQSGGCPNACSPGDPYLGTFVEDNVTFHQNNHFSNNTYKGPWRFEIHEQNHYASFSTWQAAPYGQDTASTLSP